MGHFLAAVIHISKKCTQQYLSESIFCHLKEKSVCILYHYLAPHDDAPLHRSQANLKHWKDAFKDTAGVRVKKKKKQD